VIDWSTRLVAAVGAAIAWLTLLSCDRAPKATGQPAAQSGQSAQVASSELVVRVLDVGQGDATLIENGGSRVLIDGGPDQHRFEKLLDSLQLNGTTFDVVILSHQHADHLVGLRALFESKRNITVRYFFENQDPYTAANLRHLRDSVNARIARGQLIYRDTDDPCANNTAVCTITLKGGAKIHIMRPFSTSSNPNNRSVPVKLVGPDTAAFSMWFAGDAERDAVDWFLGAAGYDMHPGMHVNILKADHHGSCNGVTNAYLNATRPELVTASLADVNSYHHMHEQAKADFRAHHIPWYRTDQNGTITIRVSGAPGAKATVQLQRGAASMSGPSDARSTQPDCNPIP
jgi:competence protein ComEC